MQVMQQSQKRKMAWQIKSTKNADWSQLLFIGMLKKVTVG